MNFSCHSLKTSVLGRIKRWRRDLKRHPQRNIEQLTERRKPFRKLAMQMLESRELLASDFTFQAIGDTFTIIEDAPAVTLDVKANDQIGSTSPVMISEVTQPLPRGTVSIGSDGQSVLFTPGSNFAGTATFTYTITGAEACQASPP